MRVKTLVRTLVIALFGLVLPVSMGVLTATPASAKVWKIPKIDPSVDPLADADEYANRVMMKINKIRAKKGKKQVKYYQGCLDQHSNKWAKHLAEIGELVHRDPATVLKACDLHWTGETLILGTGLSPGNVVTAWMHSPPHHAVIMKDRARLAGVGMFLTDTGIVYCDLNFGDAT